MRTTLDIDDRLLTEAKARAAREKRSLTSLIEEGLAQLLRRKAPGPARTKVPALPVSKCRGGMRPGIDPDSNSSILDAMDGLD